MSENKVRFGVRNLHVGTYTVNNDGTVTMGEPMHLPGTVKMSMDPTTEQMLFHADDVVYKEDDTDLGYEGEIEHASLPDDFKIDYLGYIELSDGGIALDVYAEHEPVYLLFESGGDQNARRGILYNVVLGGIKRDHETIEKAKNPQTETLPITIYGDDETGIVKVSWGPESETYSTLFTSPPSPDDMAYLELLDEEGEELQDDDGETILGNVDLKTIEVYIPEAETEQTLSLPGNNTFPSIHGNIVPGNQPQVEPMDIGNIEDNPEEPEDQEEEQVNSEAADEIEEEEIVDEIDQEEPDEEEEPEESSEEEMMDEADPEENGDEEEDAVDETAESEE